MLQVSRIYRSLTLSLTPVHVWSVQCSEVTFHIFTIRFYLCHVAGLLLRRVHPQRQESSSSATWPAIFIGQDLPACMIPYRLLSCYHELASHMQQHLITESGMGLSFNSASVGSTSQMCCSNLNCPSPCADKSEQLSFATCRVDHIT